MDSLSPVVVIMMMMMLCDIASFGGRLVLNFLPDCFMGLSAFCLLQEPSHVFCTKDRGISTYNILNISNLL